MVSVIQVGEYDGAVAAVEARLALLREEGLCSPAVRQRSAFDAYQAMAHAGRRPEARKWLAVALACGRMSKVPGCEALQEMEAKLRAAGGDPGAVGVGAVADGE